MLAREARREDAQAVLDLMAGLGRPEVESDSAAQEDVFLAHLAHPDAMVFVAEVEGAIAGAVSLWFRPRLNWRSVEAWIPDLYVDRAYRRLRTCPRCRVRFDEEVFHEAEPSGKAIAVFSQPCSFFDDTRHGVGGEA